DPEGNGTINAATVDLNTATAGIQNSITTDDGSWTVNSSGVVTFTPVSEFNGPTSITYTVNDNSGATSGTATITITVNPVNDPPVAVADAATTNEETSVTIDVTDNDSDIDGTINVATVDLNTSSGGIQNSITIASVGTFSVNTAGIVTFTPVANFNGTATVNYTVNDNSGATSNQVAISVTVNATNDPPSAVNDAVTTNEDTPVTFNVVSNDTDVDGTVNAGTVDLDPSSPGIQNMAAISGGNISVNTSGIITFTPSINFYGSTTASYTVNDNTGATSNTATISITVTAVNDPPIAVNDLTTADENEVVTWLVVSNDVDFDGSINVATVDLNPSVSGIQTTVTVTNVGTFTVDAAGLVTFTPVLNFNGVASINYTVRDNAGLASNAATLSISVNSINSDPVAANDAVTTNEEVAVTITILANDSDPDGSLIATTVDLNTATAGIQNSITVTGGTFTANTSGVVTFTPLANYSGPASTTYTVNDNVGATSNIATISVTVTSINDLPVAGNDAASTAEGTAVTFSVVANDTDIDGTINAATVDLNTTLSGIQNSNSTPAGSWTVSNLGFVTFTPVSTFSGPATLAYTVNDNSGGTSAAATITVTVSSVNDAPVAVNDAATTNEDVAVTLNVVTNDTDEDGNATINPATVDLNTATAGIQNTITTGDGTFTVNASGVVTFTPLADNNGPATTTYTVNDNGGLTSNAATITITVNSVNDLPQAQNDAATTLENTATTINVVSNDIDVEAPVNPTTVDLNVGTAGIQSSNTTPAGSWTVSAAGIVTFTPATGFNGTATLTYRVNDSDGATSNTATISVTVTAVNDLPVAANDAATTNEDVVITVNVVSNDVDDEGPVNAASVDLNTTITGIQNTISVTGGTFTVNASGIVTFTPALNYHGSAVASYTVNDGGGATSNVATITITVNSVNDAPVAANDAVTTNEDSPVTFNVVTNDSDAADDDGSINITTVDLNISTVGIQNTNSTAQGAFSVNAAGEVTFTPVANYAGTATLTYRVNDNLGLTSNTATITVTVQAINDPPVFTTIPNQRVLRNAAQKTITVTGISPGPLETEAMLLTATSGNVGLIPQPVVTYNGTAATATIAYQPAPNQTGTAIITVKLVDTGLNEYTQTFTIDVVDVQIISTPVTVAVEGELYEYFIEVTDVTETLTIAAVQKPSWATLTSLPSPPNPKNRAKLSGTPPAGAATNTEVRIQVKDGATVLNEQTFTLVVNHRPVVTSFHLDANEDEPLSFNAQDFQDVYTDQDGHPLTEIQFTQLPKHGVLRYANDNPVQITDRIAVGAISTIRYQTLPEYSGLDTLYWKASDGYSYSTVNPYIDFVISPVNDPPRVTFIEGDSLVYEVSSETPVLLTPLFNAEDVDDENLVGAELKFKEGTFTPNSDRLIFANTPAITGSFNPQTGILQLTGTAFVSDYVQAIRSVQYVYENFSSINLEGKAVLITLNDGKNSGLPAERLIRMIYTFKDLDIPSVFTANGDSRNDTWKIGVKDSSADDVEQFDKAEIRVYDKRGKLVFEAIGFAKQWDGTSLTGEPLPVDTYYYTIDLKYNKKSYKGAVTILR
ncbi:MAG TPA: tandem-95 repeat protein, partial [Ohtaekwangia sp.]